MNILGLLIIKRELIIYLKILEKILMMPWKNRDILNMIANIGIIEEI